MKTKAIIYSLCAALLAAIVVIALLISNKQGDYTYITKQKAVSIALKKVYLKRTDISNEKIELDTDDGKKYYEVEFNYYQKRFEFKIDAISGKIIEAEEDDKDILNNTSGVSGASSAKTSKTPIDWIIPEEALLIVEEDLGITDADIHNYFCKEDTDDGKQVYEIEFEYNNQKYEYKLDKHTGEILEKEK